MKQTSVGHTITVSIYYSHCNRGGYRISPREGAVFTFPSPPPLPSSSLPPLFSLIPSPSPSPSPSPLPSPPPALGAGVPGPPRNILKFYIVVGEFQCICGARNVVSNEGVTPFLPVPHFSFLLFSFSLSRRGGGRLPARRQGNGCPTDDGGGGGCPPPPLNPLLHCNTTILAYNTYGAQSAECRQAAQNVVLLSYPTYIWHEKYKFVTMPVTWFVRLQLPLKR